MHHQTDSENGLSRSKPIGVTSISEWRCTQCGKLLGMANGNQLHIRVQKHREYLVGLPVTANCHGCGTLNRKSAS
jgi:RNase P subunit RPR2